MNRQLQRLQPHSTAALPQVGEAPPPPAASHESPLWRLHALLRGRYILTVLLGLVGAVAGGVLGYRQVELQYRSEGLLRIQPYVNPSLFVTDSPSVMPMFQEYVKTQVTLMQDSRIRDMAMGDERWQKLGRGLAPETQRAFQKNLKVARDSSGQIIRVSYTDRDPNAARVAVQAVIEAYDSTYGNSEAKEKAKAISALETRKANLTVDLNGFRDKILEKAEEYASDRLDEVYAHKLREWLRFDELLKEKQLALSTSGIGADDSTRQEEQENTTKAVRAELSRGQIARRDPLVRDLVEALNQQQTELDVLRARNLGDKHSAVSRYLVTIPRLEKRIDEAVRRYNENWMAFGPEQGPISPGEDRAKTFKQLSREIQQLEAARNRTKNDTLAIGGKNLDIKRLQQDARHKEEQLAATNARIKDLTVESGGVTGRVNVVNSGVLPHFPINEGKRTQLTVLAAAGGGALGVAVILLIGLLDHRLRSSEDAHYSLGHMRLLGILPRLADDLGTAEHATIAGYAVHHIRTLLQLGADRTDGQVLAITSPTAQTGKTSLTLALGLSFAAADSKTLLIDCDLAGGGLSARLQAIIRRRVGQILLRQGLITAEQLTEALNRADSSGVRLGETLIAMGALAEDQLTDALALQEDTPIGLLDALHGEDFMDCVTATATPGLSILPIGGAHAHDMSRMSPAGFRRLIDEARKHYDTILLDTGPVPGAVETSIVAPEADQVVLIISRGDQKQAAERAIASLDWVGAHVAGWVFNRAEVADIERSMYSSSVSASVSRSIGGEKALVHAPVGGRMERFGPVARAVVGTSCTIDSLDEDPAES